MKKTYIYLAVGLILALFAINNFRFEVDSKAHYFVNGIICGVGLSVAVVQLLKLKKSKSPK